MAKLTLKHSSTSNILRVFLPDSSSTTGAGLTGLSSASSGLTINTIANNEASPTNYTVAGSTIESVTTLGTFAAPSATKARFREVDSTNLPGVYEIQLADARFSVASAKSLLVMIKGATNLAVTLLEIQLTAFDLDTATVTPGANSITSSVIADNALTGSKFAPDGTAQAGASGTITLASGASSVDDFYNGTIVTIVGGTGVGQSRFIPDYVGSTRVASVRPNWVTTPDNTSTYVIGAFADVFRAIVCESEGSYTAQQILSIVLAAAAGEWPSSGVFSSPNGVSTRISGTAAASAPFRDAITLTPSS